MNLFEGYKLADIYNVDETALYYKFSPNKMPAFAGDKCNGGKCSKVRVTVLVESNVNAIDKSGFLVIIKAKSLQCFTNMKMLLANYTANSKTMDDLSPL